MSDTIIEKEKCIIQKNSNPVGGMQIYWMLIDLKGNVLMDHLRSFMDAVIVAERAGLEVVETRNGMCIHK